MALTPGRKARILHVHSYERNGVAATTVWTKYGKQVEATTTFHTFTPEGKYLPNVLMAMPVSKVGMWREGDEVPHWDDQQ